MAHPISKKCYGPKHELIEFLQQRLQLSKEMERIDAAGGEFTREMESQNRSLRTKKTRILDEVIFPSMADVTFFFEAVAEHPELRPLFENDIKDLLGIRRNNPRKSAYAFMFRSLISAILLVGHTEYHNKDYRLKLNHELIKIAWHKMTLNLREIFKTERAQKAVGDDFDRVLAWTGMLASTVSDEYDFIHQKRYDEDIKENFPKRTFDFDTTKLLK
jgi:hypothetical protein